MANNGGLQKEFEQVILVKFVKYDSSRVIGRCSFVASAIIVRNYLNISSHLTFRVIIYL